MKKGAKIHLVWTRALSLVTSSSIEFVESRALPIETSKTQSIKGSHTKSLWKKRANKASTWKHTWQCNCQWKHTHNLQESNTMSLLSENDGREENELRETMWNPKHVWKDIWSRKIDKNYDRRKRYFSKPYLPGGKADALWASVAGSSPAARIKFK